MSEKPQNPPAFPAKHFDLCADEHGMTLRDWFAGQAFAALISAPPGQFTIKNAADAARIAYEGADAMLTERAKREG